METTRIAGMAAALTTVAAPLAVPMAGDCDVTVFQNAAEQANAALDTGPRLAKGEAVERQVMVPLEPVSPQTRAAYAGRN